MKNRKHFWRSILVICIVGCIACAGYVVFYLLDQIEAERNMQEVQKEVQKATPVPTQTPVPTVPAIDAVEFTGEWDGDAARIPEGVMLDMANPIDFKKLQAINPDLYAWIRIEDTVIDYPIAQREGDDRYYLRRDLYGEHRTAGCIFTEDENSRDFTDPNTVIYGHNMRNGTMFKGLHKFEDKTFFEEHPFVYIYTPDRVLVYEVFAAYTYDDRHILSSFDFKDENVFADYLEDVVHVRSFGAHVRNDLSLSAGDRIITLATCSGGRPDNRFLVQAVLVKDSGEK